MNFKLKFIPKIWTTRLKMISNLGFVAMCMIFSHSSAIAKDNSRSSTSYLFQADEIKGTVTDENGQILIGVTVQVKNNPKIGTVTDVNGNYQLNASSPNTVLVFSYIGFETKEVNVNGSSAINVVLKLSNNDLNEVIVVGYGTQKKATLTGAVETVSSKVFEDRAVTNVGLALQGQTPGLVVTRSSSRPGNEGLDFQIRGATSINGGSPLVVIDGVPAINFYSFQNMNSDDIESISVLKDGAAAIYGSRAANGVILVTTKKGSGKVQINYTGNLRMTANGITSYSASPSEYASVWLAANQEETIPNWWGWVSKENMEKMKAGTEGIYTTQYWGDVFIGQGNRIDEMFAQRTSYQHNLSISNKSNLSAYRVSLGYADNQATLATAYDGQKQYNGRFNYDYKLSDRFKLETGLSLVNAVTKSPSVGLDAALYANDMPFFPAKNPYGQWNANFGNVGNRNAAAATSDGGRDAKNSLTGRMDAKATFNILKDFDFEGTVSLQNEQFKQEKYVTPVQLYDWYGNKSTEVLSNTVQSSGNPGYSTRTYNSFYQYYSALLRYTKTFNKHHNFSGFGAINAEKFQSQDLSGSRAFFTDLGVYDLNTADIATLSNGGGKRQNGFYSYLAKFNYNYDEKYLVEVLGRHDGASQFAPGYKFNDFGTVLIGWVFTKESFLKGIDSFIDFGKIRASYGVLGNNAGIGNYDYVSAVNIGSTVLGNPASQQTSTSLAGNGLISLDRTWERVSEKNLGIDLVFLNNRLSASFDYFIKDNNGMFTNVAFPSVLGGSAPKTNSGHLNVKGWETVVSWRNSHNGLAYNVSFNIGDNRSLLKHVEGADFYNAGKNNINGYALNSWFLYKTDGYFRDQADVDAYYAAYAAGGGNLASLGKGTASELRPGDTKRVDVSGDGTILGTGSKTSDLQYMGDGDRHFVFGLNLGGSWKGFDLNAFFQGVGKQQIMRTGFLAYPFATIYANQPTNFEGRTWTTTNTGAEFPRLTTNTTRANWNYANNDFMLENNRYIRLKSLVIGYTIPKNLTTKVKLDRVRVYFSGNDLWEATSLKDGYDPEMGETSQNVGYPYYRTLSFGLNVGL